MSNDFTITRLNNYAIDSGFESERERFELILSVSADRQDQLEAWMDLDGSKEGLLKILHQKRPLRRNEAE